jgi:hypothetical protein
MKSTVLLLHDMRAAISSIVISVEDRRRITCRTSSSRMLIVCPAIQILSTKAHLRLSFASGLHPQPLMRALH